MTTISVPLPSNLEEFVKNQVKQGRAANKAEVVRRALTMLEEEEAVQAVLQAQREIESGKGLKGDLKKLAKKFK